MFSGFILDLNWRWSPIQLLFQYMVINHTDCFPKTLTLSHSGSVAGKQSTGVVSSVKNIFIIIYSCINIFSGINLDLNPCGSPIQLLSQYMVINHTDCFPKTLPPSHSGSASGKQSTGVVLSVKNIFVLIYICINIFSGIILDLNCRWSPIQVLFRYMVINHTDCFPKTLPPSHSGSASGKQSTGVVLSVKNIFILIYIYINIFSGINLDLNWRWSPIQ